MPQASDEDRQHARRLWGSIDDGGPSQFLKERGWHLTQGWNWIAPKPDYTPTDDEFFAIGFLIDEWDWGGIIDRPFDEHNDRF